MQQAEHPAPEGIPLYAISTGPAAHFRHVVRAPLYNTWKRLTGGPRLQRRPPLRLATGERDHQAPRALLAYLRAPFEGTAAVARAASHANWARSLLIADVLRELGYNVDVVGPLDDPDSPAGRYDLLIGELSTFTRCLPLVHPSGCKLYLATRSHPWWEYESVRRNLAELRRRSGLRFANALPRAWYAGAANGLGHADALLSFGNEFTAQTYAREGIPVFTVGNTALFRRRIPVEKKDYAQARRHFLWLGSGPLVNKGLAPVLSVFERNPHLHLWVCGPLESIREARTVWAFRRQLFQSENIHPVGWTDVHSDSFATLLRTCGWIVSASYSEARSGSVVLAAANGLVPVVVPEVGFDCGDYGLLVERPDEEELGKAIHRACKLSAEELRLRSERALAAGDREFTPAAFRRRFLEAMQEILDRSGSGRLPPRACKDAGEASGGC